MDGHPALSSQDGSAAGTNDQAGKDEVSMELWGCTWYLLRMAGRLMKKISREVVVQSLQKLHGELSEEETQTQCLTFLQVTLLVQHLFYRRINQYSS